VAGCHQSFVCHVEELSNRHIVQCAPRRGISSSGHHLTDEQAVGCSVGWFNYLVINVDVRVEQSTP